VTEPACDFRSRLCIDRLEWGFTNWAAIRAERRFNAAVAAGKLVLIKSYKTPSPRIRRPFSIVLYACPGIPGKLLWKVWKNSANATANPRGGKLIFLPGSMALQLYMIELLKGIVGLKAEVALDYVEFARDFYGDTARIRASLESGLQLKRAQGVPYGNYREKGTVTTVYLATDGDIRAGSRGVRLYQKIGKKDGAVKFYRVELVLKGDGIRKDEAMAPFRNCTEPLPMNLFDPLDYLEWRTFDADAFRRDLVRRAGLNAEEAEGVALELTEPEAARSSKLMGAVFGRLSGRGCPRRAALAGYVFRKTYGGEKNVERWRTPFGDKLSLASTYGRARRLVKRLGLRLSDYFPSESGRLEAVRAGRY